MFRYKRLNIQQQTVKTCLYFENVCEDLCDLFMMLAAKDVRTPKVCASLLLCVLVYAGRAGWNRKGVTLKSEGTSPSLSALRADTLKQLF